MITGTLILDADSIENLVDSLRTFAAGLELAMTEAGTPLSLPVEIEVHERGVNGVFVARIEEPAPKPDIPFEAPDEPETPEPPKPKAKW